MSITVPTIEPEVINAGDTITWLRSLSGYPASAGWVLRYALRGPTAIDIDAVASGQDHLVNVSGSISTDYTPGVYSVMGYVTDGSSRITVFNGSIIIKPDLVKVEAGYDGRSHVKRTLDAIEAVIEGRASKGDQQLTIDGTTLIKMTADELIKFRTTYFNLYRQELAANKRASGSGASRVRQVIPL